MRRRLGYGPEKLLVCSSGGTGVGADLLRLCRDSFPYPRKAIPDLRMLLVKGPRMDDDLGVMAEGVEVRSYVTRLFEHFAAADMAIVQGGGGTTLELAVLGTPFLYFPLQGHSEQEVNVSGKLQRYRAGVRCRMAGMTAEGLAELVLKNLDNAPDPSAISHQGCQKAALVIADKLSGLP